MMSTKTVERWLSLTDDTTPLSEVVLLALNVHGVGTRLGGRMRMEVTSIGVPRCDFLVVVPSGRETSPFVLRDDRYLEVDGCPVADVGQVCPDDAVPAYLRCQHHGRWLAATLNAIPHAGGNGTAVGVSASTADVLNRVLDGLAAELARKAPRGSLTDLQEVTVSTGCTGVGSLGSETAALESLRTLRQILNERGMSKTRIGLLSSVVRSGEAFEQIAADVAPFLLVLAVGSAAGPDRATSGMPSLQPQQASQVLARAREAGLATSFRYVVGRDSLSEMERFLASLFPHVTVFPSIEVMQGGPAEWLAPRTRSGDVGFYLKARQRIERIAPDGLLPERWRCYRPLWYGRYRGHELTGPTR